MPQLQLIGRLTSTKRISQTTCHTHCYPCFCLTFWDRSLLPNLVTCMVSLIRAQRQSTLRCYQSNMIHVFFPFLLRKQNHRLNWLKKRDTTSNKDCWSETSSFPRLLSNLFLRFYVIISLFIKKTDKELSVCLIKTDKTEILRWLTIKTPFVSVNSSQ